MRKYLHIYKILIANAISREAQFRADTWMNWFTHLGFMGFLVLLFEVFFQFTNSIAGWSKPEVFLLIIIFTISQQLFHFFFRNNLWDLPNKITDGKLDVYLTSPVNIIFLVCAREVTTKALLRIFTQFILLGWLLTHYNLVLSAWSWLSIVVLLFVGLITQVAFALIINTFSFWFLRIDNVNDAWFYVGQMGRYPLSVLPQTLSLIAFTAVPIAYQSFVPVGFGLGKLGWLFFFGALGWATFLSLVAISFWNFGLKHYESASV